MAWADISAYTAADLAKGKAEIDEVMSAITAKLAANRHRNGNYKFKVTVSKAGKSFTTAEITATIVKLSA